MAKRIDLTLATPSEIAFLKSGLEKYLKILSLKAFSNGWKEAFADFFLYYSPTFNKQATKARNLGIFFSKMEELRPLDPVQFSKDLFENKLSKNYELSYSTKACHYFNNSLPIYDKFVREYLHDIEDVPFGHKYGKDGLQPKWDALCNWYSTFIESDPRYQEWIQWFDKKFPEGRNINNVKKIDFIIFSLSRNKLK